MTDSHHAALRDLGQHWALAERQGDASALSALSTADFRLVGPFGFVLDKGQWLDRYRTGAFVTRSLRWEDVEIREYGAAAIAIGVQTQEAEHGGRAANGRFRITHFFVRDGERWLLAGVHLSPLGAPEPAARDQSKGSP